MVPEDSVSGEYVNQSIAEDFPLQPSHFNVLLPGFTLGYRGYAWFPSALVCKCMRSCWIAPHP
jgi:hypothetical protein